MREPIIEIENIYFSYDDENMVLRGISTSIYSGEKIAVIGANGAGKSTFFLNLNGVISPDNGQIRYCGNVINKKNVMELRQNVGIVFQDPDNQIIASSVTAEVSFGPMNLMLPEEEVRQRVETSLRYMNLWELRERAPHYLSGGEKKRVSIADIIAMKSDVIVFDEPTVSLDPMNVEVLKEVLKRLNDDGKTLIISTHDVDFAFKWADRIIVFSDGSIIGDGSPERIFADKNILSEAHLKRPEIMDYFDILSERGLVDKTGDYPRSLEELKSRIKGD